MEVTSRYKNKCLLARENYISVRIAAPKSRDERPRAGSCSGKRQAEAQVDYVDLCPKRARCVYDHTRLGPRHIVMNGICGTTGARRLVRNYIVGLRGW